MRRSILVILISSFAALGLIEAGLRLTGRRFTSSFYELDFDLGWKLRPHAQGWQTAEGEAYIQINSHGMRDRERSLEKPANTYRIAILGDSFAESMQAPLEKSFAALLETRLAGCPALQGGRVEALNFGVTGYGTTQELLIYRMGAVRFQPDLVILLFFAGNDLYNNHRALNPTNADAAPYGVIEEGKLTIQPPFASTARPGGYRLQARRLFTGLHSRSRIVQAATEAWYNVQRRWSRSSDESRIAKTYGKDYMEWLAYAPPADETLRQAWQVTEQLLLEMAAEVRGNGSELLLVLANNAMQVHPDPRIRAEHAGRHSVADPDYADKRIEQFAGRSGIRVVSLAGPLRGLAQAGQQYLHGFHSTKGIGHWNEAGHAAVAAVLEPAICKLSSGSGRARQ